MKDEDRYALQGVCEKLSEEALQELCDGSCTAGYDNDCSTGCDIFENGIEFGKKLRPKQWYFRYIRQNAYCGIPVAWYFVYDEHGEGDLLTRLENYKPEEE